MLYRRSRTPQNLKTSKPRNEHLLRQYPTAATIPMRDVVRPVKIVTNAIALITNVAHVLYPASLKAPATRDVLSQKTSTFAIRASASSARHINECDSLVASYTAAQLFIRCSIYRKPLPANCCGPWLTRINRPSEDAPSGDAPPFKR